MNAAEAAKTEQGSPEWKQARYGWVGASQVADVLAKLKGGKGEAAVRRNLKARVVAERLTGSPYQDDYISKEMQWGMDNEASARAEYECRAGCFVERTGFIVHPEIDYTGASPDGLVGGEGLLELKCPNTATHIGYILADIVPAEYQPQMLWQMACTCRQWCDFVSFDPRLPAHLQLFIKRFPRDDKRIAEMEREVVKFLAEVDDVLARLPKAPDSLEITDADVRAVAP